MWKPLLLAASVFVFSVSGAYAQSLDRSNPTLLNTQTELEGKSDKGEKTYYYATNALTPGNWTFRGAVKADKQKDGKFIGMYVTCYQLDGTPLSGPLHIQSDAQSKTYDYQEQTVNVPSSQPVLIELKVTGSGDYKVKYYPKEI